MDRLISCEFNMDNACVELKFLDGSMIAIDTIAVENEVADNGQNWTGCSTINRWSMHSLCWVVKLSIISHLAVTMTDRRIECQNSRHTFHISISQLTPHFLVLLFLIIV